MNCREFRRKHDAYVDDTLSGADIEGVRHHLRFCAVCAQLDTRVRRALMLAHNLPMIQPSPEFSARLQARLLDERARGHDLRDLPVHMRSHPRPLGLWRPLSMGVYAAVAAGMLAVAGLAGVMAFGAGSDTRDETIRLAPVVAGLPDPEPTVAWSSSSPSSPLTPSTMVASVPAGMPLWPAVFVAQQASWHLASDAAER